jgi:hypothetical protein
MPTPRQKDSPSKLDAIIELKPPASAGFSEGQTVKCDAVSDAVLIAELKRRGYTVVVS